MRLFMTVLSFMLLSLVLAGCGKSQAEKEADARRAQFEKMNQEYQRRLKETNERLLGPSPAKDRHASK